MEIYMDWKKKNINKGNLNVLDESIRYFSVLKYM